MTLKSFFNHLTVPECSGANLPMCAFSLAETIEGVKTDLKLTELSPPSRLNARILNCQHCQKLN